MQNIHDMMMYSISCVAQHYYVGHFLNGGFFLLITKLQLGKNK